MTQKAPLDLDQLIADIKKLAGETESVDRPVLAETPQWSQPIKPGDWLPLKRQYALSEFMVYNGVAFIRKAYRAILKREPDQQGLERYKTYLEQGGSRLFVLYTLLTSEEASRQPQRASISYLRYLVVLSPWLPPKAIKISFRLSEHFLVRLIRPSPLVLTIEQLDQKIYTFHKQLLNELTQKDQQQQQQQLLFQEQITQQSEQLLQQSEQITRQNEQIVQQNEQITRQSEQIVQQNEQMAGQNEQVILLQTEFDLIKRDTALQRNTASDLLDALQLFYQQEITDQQKQEIIQQFAHEHLENYYVAFEDTFRGNSEEIYAALNVYLPSIQSVKNDIPDNLTLIDLGCGRGEWLRLMAQQQISAQGVDLNRIMVNECRQQQLDVVAGDSIDYLQTKADASIGIITAFHIIEHLPFEQLYALFRQIFRVLKPKGMLILETPNPENLRVGSHTFYHDFTHKNPITPTSIDFLTRYTGFSDIQILRLHPYPDSDKIPGDDPLTTRINGCLSGPQDFAVIARKA
jgi:O-antigen chain-terminating methyltransferase